MYTEKIYDKFVEEAVKRFNAVKVGNPLDPATQMGSQIDAKQVAKIASYIDIAKAEGATIACGGHKLTENGLDKGNIFCADADYQCYQRYARGTRRNLRACCCGY